MIDTLEAATEELHGTDAAILEELEKKTNQLSQSKSRAIADVESQIQQLSERLIGDEHDTKEKGKQVLIQMEAIQRDYQDAITVSEGRIETKMTELRKEEGELRSEVRGSTVMMQEVKNSLEEKFTVRTVQMDQTLEAFKEELRGKLSLQDGDDMETRFKAQVSGIVTSVGHLTNSNSSIKDQIELLASKQELTQAEDKLKVNMATLSGKLVNVNERIAETNENVATRATKKELGELDDLQKAAVVKLEIRDSKLEELVNDVKEELSNRVFKKQLNELEARIGELISRLEKQSLEQVSEIDGIQMELKNRIKRAEYEQGEAKWNENIDSIANDVNSAIESTKKLIDEKNKLVYEQCALVFGKVTAQVASVESKADSLESSTETIKAKMNDSEKILRQQIKDAMQSQDSVLNAELGMLEKIKEETSSQIKSLHEKIDHVPQTIHQNDLQYQEFKRYITELVQKESSKNSQLLTDIRENVSSKVSEQDFDRIQGDVASNIQKIASQIDIEQMSIEQLRQRVLDVEAQTRDRLRELKIQQERSINTHSEKSQQERQESLGKYDQVTARINQYPKMFETINMEIKTIKANLDEKISREIARMQKDITMIKNEIPQKISAKNLDEGFSSAVGPIQSRVDNLTNMISDLQQQQKQLQQNPSDRVVPSSFFKPAHYPIPPIDDVAPYVPEQRPFPTTSNAPDTSVNNGKSAKPPAIPNYIPLSQRKAASSVVVDEPATAGAKGAESRAGSGERPSIRASVQNLTKSTTPGGGGKKGSNISLEEAEQLAEMIMPATPPRRVSVEY